MSTGAANPAADTGALNNPLVSVSTTISDNNDGPPNNGGIGDALSGLACATFGCYLIVLLIVLVYALLKIWPEKPPVESATFLGRWTFGITPERRYIAVVVIVGALGSFIHLATSFADFVGNRRLVRSWMWWYLLRPFIGIALALLFYFAFRGGLMTASSSATDLSVFGIAAMSGLAGMFSKQVTDKLREICDTAFTAIKSSPPRADGISSDEKVDAAGAGK
jgi:hypothetical protein